MGFRSRLSPKAIPALPLGSSATNPVIRIAQDIRAELGARSGYPPGPAWPSARLTHRMASDPLPLLLELYERHGPVFSMRVLHNRVVFMLGPEANHFVTVGHPECFRWRESSFIDLIPLLGDGLLTVDGAYHDRARQIMLPAFHTAQITAAVDAMRSEARQALAELRPGEVVDIYGWMRRLAMRIAMRALLGLDPGGAGRGAAAAAHFERALGFYGTEYPLRVLRGPGSPWRRLVRSRRELDRIVYAEMERRRSSPSEQGDDVLSLLLSGRGEKGEAFSDREVRDQVMTLMFAGHDTSTSTLSFLMYELGRHPGVLDRLLAEQDEVLGGAPPSHEQLAHQMPYLDMVLDETLRLYPPAWIGPRRAVRDFEFAGSTVPAGAYVNYCSWASHRLPEVFPDPDRFDPERFEPSRRAALPRGAYMPFGGGSRICIGKRFGQVEVKLVATMMLQCVRLQAVPGYRLKIRQMPTLSPTGGLPMRVLRRGEVGLLPSPSSPSGSRGCSPQGP